MQSAKSFRCADYYSQTLFFYFLMQSSIFFSKCIGRTQRCNLICFRNRSYSHFKDFFSFLCDTKRLPRFVVGSSTAFASRLFAKHLSQFIFLADSNFASLILCCNSFRETSSPCYFSAAFLSPFLNRHLSQPVNHCQLQ